MGLISNQGVRPLGDDHNEFITREAKTFALDKDFLNIAMLGHKHMLSREGGIEIVVCELATRLAARGHHIVCYDRSSSHVSGGTVDSRGEYKGVKIVPVWTIEKKGFAAMTSSFSAAIRAAKSFADVVHIHAEGPAAVAGLIRLLGRRGAHGRKKRIIVTIHGACEIMGPTGEKPVKSRLHGDSVFYPNSNTEYHIKNICSGILKRFCYIPMLLRQSGRAFFAGLFQSRCYMIPE